MAERIPPTRIEQSKWRNKAVEVVAKWHRKTDVRGIENIALIEELLANRVPVLGVGNHLGHLDGPLIPTEIKNVSPELAKNISFVMGSVIKGNALTNFLMYAYNGILFPSYRQTPGQYDAKAWDLREKQKERAYAAEAEDLENGIFCMLYPEGGRSRTRGIRPVSPNIVRHVRLVPNVHIVPIVVWLTEKVMPPDTKLIIPRFWHKPHLSIGTPIAVSELEARIGLSETEEENNQKLADEMMREIANLLPEKYRGYYGRGSSTLIEL